MERTHNKSVWRDTRGTAGKEYIIALAAIGLAGFGGMRAYGGAMGNAIDGGAGGTQAAMVASGAPADPLAGGAGYGPGAQAALTGVDVTLDCAASPADCQALLEGRGITGVDCARQPASCEQIIAEITGGAFDPNAGNSSSDPDIRDGITGWLLDKASDIGTGIAADTLRAAAAVTGWFGDRWDNVKSIASKTYNFAKDTAVGAYNFAKDAASSAFNFGKDMLGKAWDLTKSAASGVYNFGKSAVTGLYNFGKSAVTKAWDLTKSAASGVFNFGKSAVSTAWDGLKAGASGLWSGAKWLGRGAVTVGKGIVGGAAWLGYQAFDKFVVMPFNFGKDLATGAWHVAGEVADRLDRAVGSFFGELFSDGDEKIGKTAGTAGPSAAEIIEGVNAPLATATNEVADTYALVDAAKASGDLIPRSVSESQFDQIGASAEALKAEKEELAGLKNGPKDVVAEQIARIDGALKDLFVAGAALNEATVPGGTN